MVVRLLTESQPDGHFSVGALGEQDLWTIVQVGGCFEVRASLKPWDDIDIDRLLRTVNPVLERLKAYVEAEVSNFVHPLP